MVLLVLGQPAEYCTNLPFSPRFKRLKGLASARGHRQEALPGIVRRNVFADQPTFLKPAQDAAEVPGIEAEIPHDVARRRALALLDLIQHARFSQGERSIEPTMLQHTELLSVETVEAAHRGDAPRVVRNHSFHTNCIGKLLDGVKYMLRSFDCSSPRACAAGQLANAV